MFDPTAFDNMKVVIEGALYDKDSSGDIVIIDRNDLINMAKMSRRFNVSFQLPNSSITAVIEMEAKLVNLAAELIPSSLSGQLAGCHVKLQFFLEQQHGKMEYHAIEDILLNVWGVTRKITMAVHYNPLEIEKKVSNVITVEFGRLIGEDQLDDLVEMTEVMTTTIQELEHYYN
ncbi:hypothetical protein [Neobacillus vireti]|uniref:Group-specific protein n=1 Tax=Neobacillus vireti LMG 21834 TaxID=1131730 RepID=A0AB94IN51_9BACI|nr:hypothetical protein [Neobacillus vireti]ETI68460.1 hypothetical protein BAVI_12649 [Neobacillus vireti LMG 21834]KLT17240.1 hypothetical protein AA980_15265 [Neobacillus vireti]